MEQARPRKSDITRAAIVDAAVEVFYKYGYEKASLREIAQEANVTQAAIYHYFRSKEEILFEVIQKFGNELFFRLRAVAQKQSDPADKLKNVILEHVLSIKSNSGKGAKIVIEDKRFLSGDLRDRTTGEERQIFHLYRDIIAQIGRKSQLKESDYTVAAFGILGMVNSLYHWYRPEKQLSIDRLPEKIAELIFHGFWKESGTGCRKTGEGIEKEGGSHEKSTCCRVCCSGSYRCFKHRSPGGAAHEIGAPLLERHRRLCRRSGKRNPGDDCAGLQQSRRR